MRCVAVDWSGRARGAERFIWIAEARDGELVSLEAGRSREAAVAWVIAAAQADPSLVAGFDFAFSLPAWWCRARGWTSGPEVWAGIAAAGEALLAACPPPFWGRPGATRPHPIAVGLRRTEREDVPAARSAFQIGGAGAVGTGSLRGMGLLSELARAGFAVWPFTEGGPPTALEIFPRALYAAPVVKRREAARRSYVETWLADQPATLRARAIASDDAFDAAVSALAMSAHAGALAALSPLPEYALEGRVWVP